MSQADNIIFLNFEAHKPPTFKEEKSKDYVIWGTEAPYKNRYCDFLISLRNESAIHNAIVNGKVKYIAGQGFKVDEKLSLSTSTQVESWLNNVGEESALELLKKVADDREMFGGYCVRPVWNKSGDKVSYYHIDFSKVRVLKDDKGFAYTSDWTTRKPENNEDYKTFKKFDPDKQEEGTIIYYKDYRPNLQEYPNPPYLAGVNYISADIDISTFVASNTSNGFQGGTLVSFYNGEPTEEAKDKIEKDFKKKFGGADKAGGIVLSFNKTDSKAVEIAPLSDNGQDDRFINLSKQVESSILASHETANPILFGVKNESGFGNNADELRTASDHFQNTYATPRQTTFEDLFNLATFLNGWGKPLEIENLEPIKEQISIKDIINELTTDEKRALAGYAPLEVEESKMCSHSFKNESFENALVNTGFKDEEIEVVEYLESDYNPFTFAVKGLTQDLLSIILDNPSLNIKQLSELLGETVKEIRKRLSLLKNEGLIKESKGIFTPTNEGEKSELITVYKYVVRPDAPPLKTESRDFCQNLINSNRSYTREQIDSLVNQFGTDVWENRGGWYNNPRDGVTTPYCRHIWQGRTVKLKK